MRNTLRSLRQYTHSSLGTYVPSSQKNRDGVYFSGEWANVQHVTQTVRSIFPYFFVRVDIFTLDTVNDISYFFFVYDQRGQVYERRESFSLRQQSISDNEGRTAGQVFRGITPNTRRILRE